MIGQRESKGADDTLVEGKGEVKGRGSNGSFQSGAGERDCCKWPVNINMCQFKITNAGPAGVAQWLNVDP